MQRVPCALPLPLRFGLCWWTNRAVLQPLCCMSVPTKVSLLLLTSIFTLVNASSSHHGRWTRGQLYFIPFPASLYHPAWFAVILGFPPSFAQLKAKSCPFPCRIISKSTSCLSSLSVGHSRANPSSLRAQAHQAVPTACWGTAEIPKAAFPLLLPQVSRARGRGKAVGYTSTSLTWCPDVLGSSSLWTIASFSSVPALNQAGKAARSWNKDGDLFVEAQKQLKCPKTELKMPLHRLVLTVRPWGAHQRHGPCSSQNSCTSGMSATPQGELSRA